MFKTIITLSTLVFSTYSVQLIQQQQKLQAKASVQDNFILEVNHEEHKELVHCMTYPECVCHGKILILDYCDQVNEEITFNFFEGIVANLYNIQNNTNSTQQNKTYHHHHLSYSEYLPSARLAQQVTFIDTDMESVLNVGNMAVMRWKYNADNSFDMIWEWTKLSWVGIGFCPTMSNCDMMVINLVNTDLVVLLDTYSTGHDTPRTDSRNDLNLISSSVNSTGYKVRFNRKLNTGDNQDQVLTKGSSYTFCLAYSNGKSMEMHDVDGTFQFKFDAGQFGQVNLKEGGDVLFYLHAIILFVAWGVVADFGIFVGRYFKTINSYIWIHTLSFLFVDVATVVLTILMLVQGEDEEEGGEEEEDGVLAAHALIAFIILIVIFIQHGMGVVMKHFLEQKSKRNNQFVFLIKLAHIILGTTIYLAAKIEMILGFIKNEEKVLLVLSIIWFIILLIVGVILEIRKQKNKNIKNKIQPSNAVHLNTQQLLLIDMINQNATTEEINYKLPDLLWCTLNQDIYDLTDYQHPGGNFILKSVQGREISRYFYGAYGLENTTMQAYTHSQKAYELMQTKYIGSISSSLFKEGMQVKSNSWNLVRQELYTNNIALFEFQQNNTNIQLNQNASDFGQHFSITLQEFGGKIRMYTKVLTMSPPCVQFRKNVLEYFINKSGEPPKMEVTQSDTVPLIVKKYNFPGALSAQLFNHKGPVYMEGPIGRGLELKKSMKAVAFVGGTGLLPFIDLLDHLLMKSIYTVLKKTNDSKAEQFFNKNSQLGDDFEFTLNGTFLNEEEFIGREWIRQLYKINQENNLKFFNMQLRYSNGKLDDAIPTFHNRFSQEFVLKELGDFSKKVYICGPPSMNYSLLQIINQSQQDQEKVMIV